MEKHIHKSLINEYFIFNEEDNITFLIIQTNDEVVHLLMADKYSFPEDNDIPLSNRISDDFFNNIRSEESTIDIIIISKQVPKRIIDLIKVKCELIFKDINLHVLDFEDILFGDITLLCNSDSILIKDNSGSIFIFIERWIELKRL